MSRNWKLSRRISAFSVVAGALALSACSNESPTAPARAASLALAGPYAKAGIVGQQLQSPIVVKVRDAAGWPVRGETVTFSVSANGGTVTRSGITDENGRVSATWTLGTVAGIDTVTASWGTESVKIVVEAMPGTLAAFVMVSGDQLQVEAGADAALVVKAVDFWGNAIPGAPITWQLSGGSFVSASSETDANGIGRAQLQTEAGISGAQYVVQAQSADGSVAISFTVTGM